MTRPASRSSARRFAVIGALGCALGLLAGCGGPPVIGSGPEAAPPSPMDATAPESAVRDTALWLAGHYSSAAQAAADPSYFDVRLHIVPIWPDRTDGPWLYVEQAMATAQDKPYRQRIYRVLALPGNRAESVVYELPGDPLAWAGAWREPSRMNALDPALLVARAGCSVVLGYAGPGTLQGGTKGSDCGSQLRGAAYATSDVTVTATELNSWDRGFDAAGAQVWGAVKGPYRFVKEQAAPAAPAPPDAPPAPGDEAATAAPNSEGAK